MGTVYGTNTIFETVRAGLVAQMESLMAAMSGDDPKPLAVYDGHEVMNPVYPSISTGLMEMENVGEPHTGLDVTSLQDYDITAEIRLHLEHQDNHFDETKCVRLVNSINNWLESHRTALGDYLTVERQEVGIIFEESFTVGAKITLTIRYITNTNQS